MIEVKMKWIVRFVIFIYVCYKAVYGARVESGVLVDKINYGDMEYLPVGSRITINCKGTNRNQKLEWIDPFGKVIKRIHSDRVFAQEHFVTSPKGGRAPGLVLTLTDLMASDSGIYQCRSGVHEKNVSLCVLKPAEFVATSTEVTSELGRAITLTCQAKGDPEPRIVWNRNGEELSEETSSSKYKVNTKYNSQGFESLLTVTSLEASDSGLYTCISIQESPMIDDCNQENRLNLTLNVNHAPIFENGNDTKFVYGKNNQIVNLVCSASGYPLPSYRWFKDLGGDTLFEFEQKQIIYSEVDNQAVLSVTAGPTTFGQRYKCKATNEHGDSEKQFMLLRMEKPRVVNEINFLHSSSSKIEFNVTFDEEVMFAIDGFQIQYMKSEVGSKKPPYYIPKEYEWKRMAKIVYKGGKGEDNLYYDELGGYYLLLEELEPETEYWIRVRATNEAGDAPWSNPVFFETTAEDEEEVEKEEVDEPEEEPVIADDMGSNGTFYGIFFAGGIAVVAVICMFAMRWV